MENFKQYLSNDPDDGEKEAAKQVLDGLAGLRLEKKVAEVAAERQMLYKRRFWWRIKILSGTLAVIAGVAFWMFLPKEAPAPPLESAPTPVEQHTPLPQQTLPEQKKEPSPIAQNKVPNPLPPPRFPSPDVRGQNNPDKAWKTLLDQVWYTQYPPLADLPLSAPFDRADQLLKGRDFTNAYVQLQRLERKMPENDTLALLKGYCLMEMGEGTEALTYFENLGNRHQTWAPTLQWYQGLSHLSIGEREKALAVFAKIASDARHPYAGQSKKAIGLLK